VSTSETLGQSVKVRGGASRLLASLAQLRESLEGTASERGKPTRTHCMRGQILRAVSKAFPLCCSCKPC